MRLSNSPMHTSKISVESETYRLKETTINDYLICTWAGLTNIILHAFLSLFPDIASLYCLLSGPSSILSSAFPSSVSIIILPRVCPIQFTTNFSFYHPFLCYTSKLLLICHSILSILPHVHISKVCILLSSYFLNAQVSALYRSCLLYTSRCV